MRLLQFLFEKPFLNLTYIHVGTYTREGTLGGGGRGPHRERELEHTTGKRQSLLPLLLFPILFVVVFIILRALVGISRPHQPPSELGV